MTSTGRLLEMLEVAEGDAEGASARASLERCQRAARRMTHMISDLVDAASLETGTLSLDQRENELGRVMSDAIDLLQPLATRAAWRSSPSSSAASSAPVRSRTHRAGAVEPRRQRHQVHAARRTHPRPRRRAGATWCASPSATTGRASRPSRCRASSIATGTGAARKSARRRIGSLHRKGDRREPRGADLGRVDARPRQHVLTSRCRQSPPCERLTRRTNEGEVMDGRGWLVAASMGKEANVAVMSTMDDRECVHLRSPVLRGVELHTATWRGVQPSPVLLSQLSLMLCDAGGGEVGWGRQAAVARRRERCWCGRPIRCRCQMQRALPETPAASCSSSPSCCRAPLRGDAAPVALRLGGDAPPPIRRRARAVGRHRRRVGADRAAVAAGVADGGGARAGGARGPRPPILTPAVARTREALHERFAEEVPLEQLASWRACRSATSCTCSTKKWGCRRTPIRSSCASRGRACSSRRACRWPRWRR